MLGGGAYRLGRCHQDGADIGGRERRFELEQECSNATHLGRGNRRSRRDLIGFSWSEREHLDAGCSDGNELASIGHLVEAVAHVGRGYRNDIGISRRIERGGIRTGIAGSGDQHHAFAVSCRQHPVQQRVAWSGEAHVDDACRIVRRPLQTLINGKRRALSFARRVVESARGQELRPSATPTSLPCAAMAPAMAVPCWCGFCSPPSASKRFITVPSRSGCLASISESITAIATFFPVASRWAWSICSLPRTYWAVSSPLRGESCVASSCNLKT